MKSSAFKKIVIVGLGLMGGSLAAAVRKKIPRAQVVGVARRQATLHFAKRKKWIHAGFLSVKESLKEADLVVICTPVDLTEKILKEIDRAASRQILVTDVGSVKASLCDFSKNRKWKYVRFIGSHPMVGSHEQGIEFARTDLYQNGLTIVTAQKKQPGLNSILTFWKRLSGKVITMKPSEHDHKVAEISHLPHLLATCLMLSASKKSLDIAATGFRDMTRLAEGPPSVWAPIFFENQHAVLAAIQEYKELLNKFEVSLKSNDVNGLKSFLSKASTLRNQLH